MKASPQDKGREKKQKSCHINKRMYIHERMNMMEAYYIQKVVLYSNWKCYRFVLLLVI